MPQNATLKDEGTGILISAILPYIKYYSGKSSPINCCKTFLRLLCRCVVRNDRGERLLLRLEERLLADEEGEELLFSQMV